MQFLFLILITICFSTNWKYSEVITPAPAIPDHFQIYTGLDLMEMSRFDYLMGKNIGLVINHTSVNRTGTGILDLLKKYPEIKINKIFSPEHGFLGKTEAGKKIQTDKTQTDTIEIVSLYGKTMKPELADLINLDLIVFDIQDIGSRYYTYASTMSYVMEACAEAGIPFIIFDRPNPLGGLIVNGPCLINAYSSFVGLHSTPVRHGMTMGELAVMINESGWLKRNIKAELKIIPAINWQRNEFYFGSASGWLPPSPNIPDIETAVLYSGVCLLEGTNVSEGRGTAHPFKIIGAPWLEPEKVIKELGQPIFNGIRLESIQFKPESIPGKSKWPKYLDEKCNGFYLTMMDMKQSNPLNAVVKILQAIQKIHPDHFRVLESHFLDNLYGNEKLRNMLESNGNVEMLIDSWAEDENHFIFGREPYLIYP